MDYIKGKYKSAIFESESGYKVGLFRVKESSISEIVNKTITFTGYFNMLTKEDLYLMNGNYIIHDRYGYQFQVANYERIEPVGTDAVVEFLTSSFVKGCGEKTAIKIVNILGDDAVKLIKEDKNNLLKCGISITTADKIYNSIMSYYDQDEIIIYLKGLDFTVKEISKILALYGKSAKNVVMNNLYSLVDFIEFDRLDKIFFKIYEENNDMRIMACIIEAIKRICFNTGNTYVEKESIYEYVLRNFEIDLYDIFDLYIEKLEMAGEVVVKKEKYYLTNYYEDEEYIADTLYELTNQEDNILPRFDSDLEYVENEYGITYNDEQIDALKECLKKQVSILTGGPGTGKTTIIKGLIKIYQETFHMSDLTLSRTVALLAPTGRAAKRLSYATGLPAMTIHRYLKWNKDTKEFGINEYNPNYDKLVIVDEVSMIDNELMASLLRGIEHDGLKIIFVGDEYQLPSVGPGNVLKDLISSDMIPYKKLNYIYRQSDNSFIPILASEIKDMELISDYTIKRDDYNFLMCDRTDVKEMISKIVLKSIEKGLNKEDIQILAPMYKSENGIDNLNIMLQGIFNPPDKTKEEVSIGPITYRVGDKIINLVNDVDQNIFNGDIGYIINVNKNNSKEFLIMDFDGKYITLKREDIGQIKHAYALSIHKSQGSEFNHVIMPITPEYRRMLYNKLLYTGVSRAKKSLVIIGDPESLKIAVKNNYSTERKTYLKELLLNKIN